MMEPVQMDTFELQSLSFEVFHPLFYAKCYEPSLEVLGRAVEHYNTIIDCPSERLLDTIIFERQVIAKAYGKSIPNVSPTVYFSNVMWEYVYIIAYYLNRDSTIWKTHLFPRMRELARHPSVSEDMKKGEKLVDAYIERRKAFETDLGNFDEQSENSENNEEIAKLKKQITELQEQIAAKDAEIAELKRPKPLRMSFVETNGKEDQKIEWAFEDVFKAIDSPAMMAECLVNLQILGMLRGQQRTGKIKNVKAMYKEIKDTYGVSWTYDALAHAILRIKKPKSATIH